MVAESMVKEALEYPWLNDSPARSIARPVVVVGTILNRQPRNISTSNEFVADP